jgi:aspartyl-tRNA(Asn)/glutamyl-tRNA(Gln) amidotransferase subunit A
MTDFSKLTIKTAGEGLRKGDFTAVELAQHYLDQISGKNDFLNAYLEVYSDVIEQAEKAQVRIDAGEKGALIGIPIAIKDNILIEGRIASASSKVLENYKATYTSTAAQKIIEAGAVLLGRVNMDEFAMGGSTENSAYGVTRNPIDTSRVPGGSSGGSATVVAADMAMAALGSDTGGSIRQPASFCGVVGLKPTYGSVSRHGLIAMASSLDVIGPITRTTEDAEIIFNTIKGLDKKDSTTVDTDKSPESIPVKKIGVPFSYLEKGIEVDVLEAFKNSLKNLEKAGYEIVDVELPNLEHSLAVYYVLMPAEVSSNMARYDGVKYGENVEGENLIQTYFKTRGEKIGAEVKRRIMLGTYVLSAGYADQYYKKAWAVRNLISEDVKKAFEQVDVIAVPTSPTPPFKIGEKTDPIQMYLADIFTIFANLAGVPAISIPDGFVERETDAIESTLGKVNLPTGLQLVAPQLCESRLFELGQKFEILK